MPIFCKYENCNTQSYFNYFGEKPMYCKKHIKPGMINVTNRHCEYSNCTKQPVFNKPGELVGKFCKEHCEPEMINVRQKCCASPNCYTQASYNFPGKKPLFCNTHKEFKMIYVLRKLCEFENCNTQAHFNFPGKRPLVCSKHKKPEMINVTAKLCVVFECHKYAIFNISGEKPLYCGDHCKPDMINVMNFCCKKINCAKRATLGYLGNTVISCAEHKSTGMIRNPNKKCIICKTKARYMTDAKSFFCESHKPKMAKEFGDVCIICCTDVEHGETKCQPCIDYEKRGCTLKRGLKEQTIKTLLDKDTDLSDYTHDTTIPNGCLNRRPDFRFQRAFNTVILEVDEDQHRQYNCSCETSRMKNIYHANGESNMTFIRYNPDKYKPSYGSEWIPARRHDLLKKILREECGATEEKPHGIKVIYLFYNGFSELDLHVDLINPYLVE